MKNLAHLLLMFLLFVIMTSCEEEMEKNSYSELFSISFEGQTGETVIDIENSEVSFQIFTDNQSEIKISEMTISAGAIPSTPVDGTLDFNNEENSVSFILTSESGKNTKVYTIYLDNLAPEFIGSWKMTKGENKYNFFVKYCDGGNCGLESSLESSVFTSGSAAADNTISFTLDGFDEESLMFGQYSYGPGADGEMGTYEHTHATSSEVYDFNNNYGVLFSNGFWELNLGTNRITFFNADRSASVKTYTDYLVRKHWAMGADSDGSTEMFTMWLTLNRAGMLSAQQAWATHGADDPTLAYIMGGFAAEFNMVKDN